MSAGQDLGQQALEQDLPQAPADLRGPEDLLEPGDVPADLLHAAGRLAEGPQLAVHLGHRPRGLLEALAHRLLGVLHQRHAVLEAPVHLGRHLLELHRDGTLELPEALPDLPAEAGHLLVHRRQGRVLAAVAIVADARDLALEDLQRRGPGGRCRRPPRAAGEDHEPQTTAPRTINPASARTARRGASVIALPVAADRAELAGGAHPRVAPVEAVRRSSACDRGRSRTSPGRPGRAGGACR